jgi:adenylate cyclase
MRTLEEIREDFDHAKNRSDAPALRALALEMQSLGTPEAAAHAHHALGVAEGLAGDFASALEHYRRALAFHEERGDRAGVASVSTNIGNAYLKIGDFASALESYGRSRELYEELGNRGGVALVTGNIGIVFNNTGDFASALEHYHRALAVLEELGKLDSVARNTQRIGSVYSSTGDYDTALDYYRRAQVLSEELGDHAGVANVISSIGSLYKYTGDDLSALDHYRRSLAMFEQLGDRASIVRAVGNVISMLAKLDRYDEAEELLALQGTMPMDDPAVRTQRETNRASLAEHRRDLESAHQHLQEALSIALHAGLRAYAAECRRYLRDLAQKRNDFAGFIEHNAEYLRLTEEVRGKEATQRIAIMEAERRMEGERRDREKERALLYSALPESIADRMIRGDDVSGDHFDHAAVMFLDVVSFTSNTSSLPPSDVVKMLENIFSTIDAFCDTHNVVKIKTIGDSYMCFRGDADASTNARSIALVALDVMQYAFTWPNGTPLQFRAGIHIGPATAGVIGTQRLQYDVWGDTVNVASRMESSGEAGRVHVSEAFADNLKSNQESRIKNPISESHEVSHEVSHAVSHAVSHEVSHEVSHAVPLVTRHLSLVTLFRGSIDIKGKGLMQTYWLEANE